MEKYERKSYFLELKRYCVFANENDYIEVTEWKNQEGFDVDVSGKLNQRFQITHVEFEELKKIIKKIIKKINKK